MDVKPFYFSSNKKINKYLSIRFSEYEPINTAVNLKNKVGWIWIDTFKNLPIKRNNVSMLTKFNSCLFALKDGGGLQILKILCEVKEAKFFTCYGDDKSKICKKMGRFNFNF